MKILSLCLVKTAEVPVFNNLPLSKSESYLETRILSQLRCQQALEYSQNRTRLITAAICHSVLRSLLKQDHHMVGVRHKRTFLTWDVLRAGPESISTLDHWTLTWWRTLEKPFLMNISTLSWERNFRQLTDVGKAFDCYFIVKQWNRQKTIPWSAKLRHFLTAPGISMLPGRLNRVSRLDALIAWTRQS